MTFEDLQRSYDNETEEDYESHGPERCEVCGSIVVGDSACKACANLEEVEW